MGDMGLWTTLKRAQNVVEVAGHRRFGRPNCSVSPLPRDHLGQHIGRIGRAMTREGRPPGAVRRSRCGTGLRRCPWPALWLLSIQVVSIAAQQVSPDADADADAGPPAARVDACSPFLFWENRERREVALRRGARCVDQHGLRRPGVTMASGFRNFMFCHD